MMTEGALSISELFEIPYPIVEELYRIIEKALKSKKQK